MGAYTAEGAAAGHFATVLAKQREEKHAEYERKKAELERAAAKPILVPLSEKFVTSSQTQVDALTAAATIGLMSVEQRQAARAEAERLVRMGAAPVVPPVAPQSGDAAAVAAGVKRRRAMLSFRDELEGEEEEEGEKDAPPVGGRARLGKDPTVPTDFLPDADREKHLAELKVQLREEWLKEQERLKGEKIEVVYSWWDGTGHRRSIQVTRGTSIGRFLEWVRQDLVPSFPALKSLSADGMMYIKEDVIIPAHYTFHDLITSRARGKSGPLFRFDVHDDVRLRADNRVEKDESHPGKIVERRWYEHNKHIFPCSRWEIYDPSKVYSTTAGGGSV